MNHIKKNGDLEKKNLKYFDAGYATVLLHTASILLVREDELDFEAFKQNLQLLIHYCFRKRWADLKIVLT